MQRRDTRRAAPFGGIAGMTRNVAGRGARPVRPPPAARAPRSAGAPAVARCIRSLRRRSTRTLPPFDSRRAPSRSARSPRATRRAPPRARARPAPTPAPGRARGHGPHAGRQLGHVRHARATDVRRRVSCPARRRRARCAADRRTRVPRRPGSRPSTAASGRRDRASTTPRSRPSCATSSTARPRSDSTRWSCTCAPPPTRCTRRRARPGPLPRPRNGVRPATTRSPSRSTRRTRAGCSCTSWFNPFRAAPPDGKPAPGARTIARTHPEWVVRYGSQQWIDPGVPARARARCSTRSWRSSIATTSTACTSTTTSTRISRSASRAARGQGQEAAHGRHDARPSASRTATSWARYGRDAGWDEPRRLAPRERLAVRAALYREVKAHKPCGRRRHQPVRHLASRAHPRGVSGLDAYSEIYADSRRWLREGWVDYLAPQLYWRAGRRAAALPPPGRVVAQRERAWAGTSVAGPADDARRVARRTVVVERESRRQIDWLRTAREGTTEARGHVHFRLASLMPRAQGGLGDRLSNAQYARPRCRPRVRGSDGRSPHRRASPPGAPCRTRWRGRRGAATRSRRAAPSRRRRSPCDPPTRRPSAGGSCSRATETGTWHARVVPGSERRVDARLSDGAPVTAVGVSALSPSGVQSEATLLRLR